MSSAAASIVSGPPVAAKDRYWFDRTASPALLAALAQGGPLHGLIERREAEPFLLDVQFRKDTKSDVGHVGLYAGLSSILRVFESGGLFRLESHRTYRELGGFEPQWRDWMTGQDLAIIWPDVDFYIQTILDDRTVLPR